MQEQDDKKIDHERVLKHLEMIQGIVNRLGHNSFLIKGWSMTILAAGIIFIARSRIESEWFVLTFLIPVIGFWILDGYFLWQERLFRKVYDDIRKQETTDFDMKPTSKKSCSFSCSMFSVTLIVFYMIEITFVFAAFFIIRYLGGNSQ